MKINQCRKWWLDLFIFVVFLLAFFVDLTGVNLHQWVGVMGGVAALVHFIIHWKWVFQQVKSLFNRHKHGRRIYLILDALLFAGFFTMLFTGIAISAWFDLYLRNYADWRAVHIGASIGSLLVTVVKILLHQGWVVSVFRRMFPRRDQTAETTPAALQEKLISRRGFLILAVSIVPLSFLAIKHSLEKLLVVMGVKSEIEICPTRRRCYGNCHFPGRCHKYIDLNNNKHCDLGECM